MFFYHWWLHCAPTPLGLIGLRYKLSAHMQKFRLLFRKLSESLTFQNVLKFKFCLQLSDLKLFGPRILFWTHILFSPKLSLDRNLFLTLIFNKLFVLLYIFDNFLCFNLNITKKNNISVNKKVKQRDSPSI